MLGGFFMFVQEGNMTLRSFEDKDVEQTLQVMNDFKVKHYIPGAYCSNINDAKTLVQMYQNEFNGRSGYASSAAERRTAYCRRPDL